MNAEYLTLRKLCTLFLVIFLLTGCDNGDSNFSAKVLSVSGKVEIRPNTETAFADAKVNDILASGGLLKTGEASAANLEITGKGTMEIKEDCLFELKANKDYVVQNSGMAIYKIDKNPEGFKVKSPQGITCVLGTRFMVRILDNMTVVGVDQGKVSFTSNKGETRVIEAKKKLTATNDGFSGELEPFDIGSDSFHYQKIDNKWVPKK